MRILKRRNSDKHVVKRSWRLFWQSLALATTEDVLSMWDVALLLSFGFVNEAEGARTNAPVKIM